MAEVFLVLLEGVDAGLNSVLAAFVKDTNVNRISLLLKELLIKPLELREICT